MLAGWSIRKRLVAGFGSVLVLTAVLGGLCIRTMGTVAGGLGTVAEQIMPAMALATAYEREILNARIHFIYHVTVQKPGALELGWKRYREARTVLPQLQTGIGSAPALSGLRNGVNTLAADMDAYEKVLHQILGEVAAHRNQGEAFTALVAEWARLGGRLVTTAGQLNAACSKLTVESAVHYRAELDAAIWSTWVFYGLALAVSLVACGLIVRLISRVLRASATDLHRGAVEIASASSRVANAAQALAESAQMQAATIEETSACCEEIKGMAASNAESAQEVASMTSESHARSQSVGQTLDRMVTAMRDIAVSSEKVSRIIKVIDEIAFQTNILALNAAVEAARAGESGLGFAVVADEVRTLAQRSAAAARDTADLIEESNARTTAGRQYVAEVAEAMRSIATDSTVVKEHIEQVNSGSQEQTKGIEQMSRAIAQLEDATQRAAVSAEESAETARQMIVQSDALKGVASSLNLLVSGQSGKPTYAG